MQPEPRIGIGVFVFKDGKILMGKRKNAHGDGCWGLPGGHLRFWESWEECARREVLEETGLVIENIRFETVTNDFFKREKRHYITIFMTADAVSVDARLMEPDKCEKWEWFVWQQKMLPAPLFLPLQNLLKSAHSLSFLHAPLEVH